MKKIIALILSLVMIFSLLAPAASAVDGKCNCGITPIIYVGPLGNTDIYENPGAENQKTLFRPDTKTILEIVVKLIPGLFKLAFFDFNGFGDVLIDTVYDAMGAMALDGNGDSADNVDVIIEMPEEQEHSKDSQYYFHYDWRLDPVEVAGQLDEFVKYVMELTGHDKVHFRASSMGGVATLAYFNEYGTDDVDACVFQSCPLLGTDVAGDLLCRKLKLDARALLDYATDGYPPFTFEDTLLWCLFNGLYYSGLVDTVLFAGDIILEKLETKVFDELMTPVFGTLLGLWA
ncbi:MAG: hypothetical protein IJ264_03765, partial [Clostridia bacterium]|nr:hypothetical protein [Clostridia bacterium]